MAARRDHTPTAALILLAAGTGQRSGHATNKVLLPLAGRRVFTWSLDWTSTVHELSRTVLVVRGSDRAAATAVLAKESPGRAVTVVPGGDTRHDSEWAGLTALAVDIRAGAIDVVVIHDAARPLAGSDLFRDVISAAREHGGALPGRPMLGLLPRTAAAAMDGAVASAGNGAATTTPGNRTSVPGAREHSSVVSASNARAHLNGRTNGAGPTVVGPARTDGPSSTVAVQTPQAFRAEPLLAAYEAAAREGFVGSDTAACIEQFAQLDIVCLPGAAHNIKITFPEDLFVAERLLARSGFSLPRRVGRSR